MQQGNIITHILLQANSSQMDLIPDLSAYREAEAQVDGKRIHDFVLNPLDWDIRQEGTESDVFKTELEFHKKASTEKFVHLFVSAYIYPFL